MGSPESGPIDSVTTGTDKLLIDFPAEAVARLTISIPDKRNALDHDVLDAISSTLPRLDRGIDIRCLIVTGADPVFSAGYDISSIADESFERDAEALVAHPFTAALEALDAFPWPTVAALNGHCLGGGLELAITCDLRICAAGAKLGMPPAKLGLIYGHTGLMRFIETIGAPRTRELFFTGNNLEAKRAEAINLVNRVVPDGEIGPESVELARGIAENAPLSTRGNKRAIATIVANPVLSPEQEAELVELRESCFASADFHEGIAAFGEKRKPRWTGR
ncbi:MAG: enoyl-CoA hydratase/isomerase family protein [Thermoleophilia bacterium]|nr:enoyl-CoA hydratase/isomerase family protein [Thermoleophilia bacterium]